MRCLIWTLRVVSGSPSLNVGNAPVAGVSQVSFPASTSFARMRVAIAFVFDAIMYFVSASTFAGSPSSRTPKPTANTVRPS